MSFLLLEASNVEKAFADVQILNIKNFRIYAGDRIGFVGPNGCGKTTLLNILSGEMAPDSGSIRRWCDIAYIHQFFQSIHDEAADSHLARKLGQYGVLAKAGNPQISGGEATRIQLVQALSTTGQLVFADEPTSSLDIYGVKQFSRELEGIESFILISHDRALLNRHCNRIITLENGDIAVYEGNYGAYKEQVEAKRQRQVFEYEQYKGEKERLTRAHSDKKSRAHKVEKKPRGKSSSDAKMQGFATNKPPGGKARSLEQAAKAIQARIDQMDVKERPREQAQIKLNFALTDPPRNKVVLSGEGINFSHGDISLFENAAFEVENGARIALQGINGSGKTTLLNLINHGDKSIYTVPKLRIGYFRQGFENIDPGKTVLQNTVDTAVQKESTIRAVLARLLFNSDSIKKPAGVLSGGERVKLGLAKLLLSDCNMLLMDEPTNFLDMPSLEVLQGILAEYEGTMIFVSHDQSFVDAICTELMVIEGKNLIQYKRSQ